MAPVRLTLHLQQAEGEISARATIRKDDAKDFTF